jgi:hypothetical protein
VTDAQAALRSIFHGDHYGKPDTPWPAAAPYVVIWCPAARRRCRMGGVYATRWGFLLLRRSYRRVRERENGIEFHGGGFGGSLIPADPTQALISGPWHCRHGQPEDWWTFDITEVMALVEAVRLGQPRPADYVWRPS